MARRRERPVSANPAAAERIDLPNGGSRARQLALVWGPVLAWMAAIFYFSSQSALGGMQWPPIFQALRKSAHIVEYAGLAVLVGRALAATLPIGSPVGSPRQDMSRARAPQRARTWPTWQIWVLGTIICTAYALTDELHQSFVPRRGAHYEDVIVDALSAVLGLGLWYLWRRRARP